MLDNAGIDKEVWIDLTPDDDGVVDAGIYLFDNRLTPDQARYIARRLIHHATQIEHVKNTVLPA